LDILFKNEISDAIRGVGCHPDQIRIDFQQFKLIFQYVAELSNLHPISAPTRNLFIASLQSP
jgi:hypothetical protein